MFLLSVREESIILLYNVTLWLPTKNNSSLFDDYYILLHQCIYLAQGGISNIASNCNSRKTST